MKPYSAFFHLFFGDRDPGDFPLKFSVEVTNHCNLRCVSCPREESGRGYGLMDEELFSSLADQAAGKRTLFYPQGFGESFLHPLFPQYLRLLRERGVKYPVCITNATLLTPENARVLLEDGAKMVIISLDGGDKETYEGIRRKADFGEVWGNVERFLELRDELESRYPHVILSVVGSEAVLPTIDELEAHWEPKLRRTDEIFVCTPVSWAGTWDYPGGPPLEPPARGSGGGIDRPPCRNLYKTLSVYYDGRVTPCPLDHQCKLEVGNANEERIEDIWRGEKIQRLRDLHEAGRSDEIELCRGCPDALP